MGNNLTGLANESDRKKELLRAAEEFPPTSHGKGSLLAQIRVEYARNAAPVGSVPMPAGLQGKVKAAGQAVRMMDNPSLLMDKLGERLAFEATGTRLYEALISKCEAKGSFAKGPTVDDLREIHADEHRHFLWLKDAIEKLGGDPTALTPAANVAATASMGLPQVIADPRTSLLQCLDAVLMAELMDNDAWEALIELVDAAGEEELKTRFKQALAEEGEHLRKIRMWLAAGEGRGRAYRQKTTN